MISIPTRFSSEILRERSSENEVKMIGHETVRLHLHSGRSPVSSNRRLSGRGECPCSSMLTENRFAPE
jgi:hypothetical protein